VLKLDSFYDGTNFNNKIADVPQPAITPTHEESDKPKKLELRDSKEPERKWRQKTPNLRYQIAKKELSVCQFRTLKFDSKLKDQGINAARFLSNFDSKI
jgi:hypothetical protein